MPSIVILADDGTVFELPEESAGFSDLLKGAMDQWTRRHDAATTPSSLHPLHDETDGLRPSDDDDDSTAEDVGRPWPLGADDASTCSQLSDFPEEDRYFQGASALGLKQSVERLPSEGFGAAGEPLLRRHVVPGANGQDDELLADDVRTGDASPVVSAPVRSGEAAVGATAPLSDTDSDRTASIAPDMDSRSHSTASSQGSFAGTGFTPPRAALPGMGVSPGSPSVPAGDKGRDVDAVKVSSGSSSSDSSSTASGDLGSDAEADEADGVAAAVKDDGENDSATPSSLSEDEEALLQDGDGVVPSRVSGASSSSVSTNRRSVSAAPSGEHDGDDDEEPEAAAPPTPTPLVVDRRSGSEGSTPETLSPSAAGEEEVVAGELRVGSPGSPMADTSDDDAKHKAGPVRKNPPASIKGKKSAGRVRSPKSPVYAGGGSSREGSGTRAQAPGKKSFVSPHNGPDAPLRGGKTPAAGDEDEDAGERRGSRGSARSNSSSGSINGDHPRTEGHPCAGSLTSPSSSSGSQSGSRKSSGGTGVTKSPNVSLRERLEDASLRNNSDEDSSGDDDGLVEAIRQPIVPSHGYLRGTHGSLTTPPSSAERGSAGRHSSGGSGNEDRVTSVRKAYTVVVSAAEPLADDDDDEDDEDADNEDEGGGDVDVDVDGENADADLHAHDAANVADSGAQTPREDGTAAAQLRSPVDPGMPSTIAGADGKSSSKVGDSPRNFHQRTPVMIGADEECVHLVSSDGQATIRTPKEGMEMLPTLSAGATPALATPVDVVGMGGSGIIPTSSAASTSDRTGSKGASPAIANSETRGESGDDDDDDDESDAILYDGAVISKHKIVVDLVNSNTNSTPSQGVSPRPGTSDAAAAGGAAGAASTLATGTAAASSASSAAVTPPRAMPVDSVRLCVEYLQHFATLVKECEAEHGDSSTAGGGLARSNSYGSYDSRTSVSTTGIRTQREREARPTELPMPLTRPLAALLTDWELDFLYSTVLCVPDAAKNLAKQATVVCPELDYRYPGMYLQKEPGATALREALKVPAPEKAGLLRLRELLTTAKQLRVEALVQLLTAWLADYMLRMCYCGADNFEAAHLIRLCFQVQTDFKRRELEHLKVENEWPANEEE